MRPLRGFAILPAIVLLLLGCATEEAPPLPTAEELASYYEYSGDLSIAVSGNVPQVTVTVDRGEYARGGLLWAKAFPYLFLFSPGTKQLFDDHPGVGGVRVIIRYEDGSLVSQALLEKGRVDLGDWNRALTAAAEARQDGTRLPQRMDDLVQIGEEFTDFEYDQDNMRPTQ